MQIKPLSNHVLVAPVEDEARQTKSGIVLPDTADKKKQSKGTVVAIGPGKMNEAGGRAPMSVAVGQTVLFKEPWGDENKIEDGDKKYFLVEEDDIFAVIE
jgi:chaperonin GroES